MSPPEQIAAPSDGSARHRADARFWDRIAARYARTPIADADAYAHKLELTRAHLSPDASWLELGCGTGSTALEHAPHLGHLRATDLSPSMIAIARRRAEEAGVRNLTFEVAAAETVSAPAQSLDGVLALNVLHLLEDPPALLHRIHGMLAPGGVLVTSTGCLSEAVPWLRPLAPVGRVLRLLPRLRFFTRRELEDWLDAAGFDLEVAWRPSPRAALFLVARRREAAPAGSGAGNSRAGDRSDQG